MEPQTISMYEPYDVDTKALHIDASVDDFVFLQLAQRRIFTINEDIEDDTASIITQTLSHINAIDSGIPVEERMPIKLFITSDGGDVFAGFAIADMIQSSITPVYTINTSHQYCMGAIIGIVGHKRYATKNASFLIHDGSTFVGNSAGKVQDFMKFDKQVHERMKHLVLDNSNISAQTYNKKFREEWYFFADEAKRLGVIDGIIGEDVSLEDII